MATFAELHPDIYADMPASVRSAIDAGNPLDALDEIYLHRMQPSREFLEYVGNWLNETFPGAAPWLVDNMFTRARFITGKVGVE